MGWQTCQLGPNLPMTNSLTGSGMMFTNLTQTDSSGLQ